MSQETRESLWREIFAGIKTHKGFKGLRSKVNTTATSSTKSPKKERGEDRRERSYAGSEFETNREKCSREREKSRVKLKVGMNILFATPSTSLSLDFLGGKSVIERKRR